MRCCSPTLREPPTPSWRPRPGIASLPPPPRIRGPRAPPHPPPHQCPEPRTAMTFPSDLDIARSVSPRPITDVAGDLGLRDDEIELYGRSKAKVTLEAIRRVEAEHTSGEASAGGA